MVFPRGELPNREKHWQNTVGVIQDSIRAEFYLRDTVEHRKTVSTFLKRIPLNSAPMRVDSDFADSMLRVMPGPMRQLSKS